MGSRVKQPKDIKSDKGRKNTTRKIPYHHQPTDMELDEWQIALRKQYAADQEFTVENIGMHSVFSDYSVFNPKSGQTYKVAMRSKSEPLNFCSCPDFKTNELGTCKHIEYVKLIIESSSHLNKIYNTAYEPEYSSVFLMYGAERQVCLRIGSDQTGKIKKLSSEYFDRRFILKRGKYAVFNIFVDTVKTIQKDFRCYDDALEYILSERGKIRNNLKIDRKLKSEPDFFSTLLKTQLFEFQQQGIEFAARAGRALIADDMGLGKTIQAIGVAEFMKKLHGISKVLVICPTSLKYQWKTEVEKFTGNSVGVIGGGKIKRIEEYKNRAFFRIISYNAAIRDVEEINQEEFDLIILDEAQRIKNWQTSTAVNIKKLNSEYCLVLTGTPLENKLEELYSIVQMIDPLKMGAIFRFLQNHQILNKDTGKVVGYKDLNLISGMLKDCMIRRHKNTVLKQLPERMDKNLFVPMTQKQSEYYEEFFEAVAKLVRKWIHHKFLSEKDRQKLLINLNQMRMVCDSTFILDQKTRHDTKIDELMNIVEQVMQNGDEKIVVFSQWERMTRIIGHEMGIKGIDYRSLHGGISGDKRGQLFDDFKNIPSCRVFLSTDAGGVGLNLQSASMIVNMDLPWNPAVLEQRIARIHRMGQKRKIQVINLIATGTIESEMLKKLKFKSSMAAGVLDNGESTIFLEEGKFKALMKQVADLMETSGRPVVETQSDRTMNVQVEDSGTQTESIGNTDKGTVRIAKEPEERYEKAQSDMATESVVSKGLDFINSLFDVLSDEKKTESLISEILRKDEKTGESYMHIPVKNQEMLKKGIMLFRKLFNGID